MSRVVLVTGASSGLGRATARRAAEQGYHVVLFARGLGPLEEAAQECRDVGAASAHAVAVDVTDAIAVRVAVDQVSRDLGQIDAVVHSAGVIAYGRFDAYGTFDDVPTKVFDAVIRTNVLGSANVSRAVLPRMRERNSGVVVLMGSLSGHLAAPSMSSYTMSKWAVQALARELQIANRDRSGVHVSLVAPTGADTPVYLKAANLLGRVRRVEHPAPPVASPEKVVAAALALIDRPRPRDQIGAINRVVSTGFGLFPSLYAIVTPALRPRLERSGDGGQGS
jgi:NAD(P)-dependent dehydrogenase (short-subunit alcohol dehydrogenase family)